MEEMYESIYVLMLSCIKLHESTKQVCFYVFCAYPPQHVQHSGKGSIPLWH